MVLESVLVQVLNRFLGVYVENLDPSQLTANVWSGDVKLDGLKLKGNALDKFDLPFRIFAGYLDKFHMNVPWKKLYTDPVIVEIDGVYIIAGPAAAVRYDADTDLREQREAKEKQLKHVDETKKKTEVKEKKSEEAPGFVEKLVTNIVKNVKVTVRNIHIQYEDSMTNYSTTSSFGVTLDSLIIESTDSSYVLGGSSVNPDPSLIYKIMQLNCLSVYWNSNADLFGPQLPDNWKDLLRGNIARPNKTPDMQYIVNPISATAKVRLSTKPGQDMHIPQALVTLVLQEVALTLSKQQYQDIMNFIESLDRLSISQRFRRYRPLKPPGEDKRAWWRYAFDTESADIKRRMEAWSWSHIKAHRETCRSYTEAYKEKLLAKSVSPALANKIQSLEDRLDVFNITVCRQLADNQAQRERKLQEEKKAKSGGGGFWSWITGRGAAADPVDTGMTKEFTGLSEDDIAREKEKLYQAIGYAKDSKLPDYPKEYVAHNLTFELKKVSVELQNEDVNIAHFVTREITAHLKHRPTSNNISVDAMVKTVHMNGMSKDAEAPTIIEVHEEKGSLMRMEFEMNPLQSQANYRAAASLSPILVFYDAVTVDAMIGMFLLPKDVHLQSISAAAASALEGIKTQSRAGLEHIIGERTFFEVDFSLKSPCLLIPEGGVMKRSSAVIVADLGSLKVTTDLTSMVVPDVRTASLEKLQEASYDNFNVQISNVQLIMTGPGEDWKEALLSHDSTHHLLKPSGLDLVVKKSILPMDTRLPSLIMSGTLPSIALSLSDKKVKQAIKLVKSLPLPPASLASKPAVPVITYKMAPHNPTKDAASVIPVIIRSLPGSEQKEDKEEEFDTTSAGEKEAEVGEDSGRREKEKGEYEKSMVSATKLKSNFAINEIVIVYSECIDEEDIERLKFLLSEMEAELVMRSWDLSVTASIGSAEIQDHFTKGMEGKKPHLLLSSGLEGRKFLNATYFKNDRQSPDYASSPHPTEHTVAADMSVVKVQILKGSLVKLMSMGLSILAEIKSNDQAPKDTVIEEVTTITDEGKTKKSSVVRRCLPGEREVYIEARFGGLEVTLGDEHGDILSADMTDLSTSVTVIEEQALVTASMLNITVTDKDPDSCHTQVVSKLDDSTTVISAEIKVFMGVEKTNVDISSAEMCVSATVQRLTVFIVFKFVNRVMDCVNVLMDEMDLAKSTYGLYEQKTSSELKAAGARSTQKMKNGSKIGLSVSVSAPLVVLPLTSTSSSAFVADLGHMEVTNTFLPAEKVAVGQHPSEKFLSSGGIPAIVDDMTVDITSVQLFKVNDTTKLKREDWDHMVITPIQFHGHVIRKLSDWCSVVPDIIVDAELPSLEVQLGPGDYGAIFSLMNSLGDGKPTKSPSDKGEDKGEDRGESDGGGEKGEKESKELESKEPEVPTNTKDATSSEVVELLMKFRMKEVVLHLNEQSADGNVERLKFLLSEMETELVMRSWDLNVTASIGSAKIQDLFTKGKNGEYHILLSSGSVGKKFLDVQYYKDDPVSPHYGSSPHPTEHTVAADMSVVKVQILKGSLVKLMSTGLSILDELKSGDQSPQDFITKVVQTDEGKTKTVSVARQHLPGEREVYVEARFGGLEVTLGDEHGDILSADMTEFATTIAVLEERTMITASMKDIAVTDQEPHSHHSKVVSKMDDSATVISAEIEVFKSPGVDISSAEMCVSATVQRLTVFIVFKFVNRVMDCVNVLMDEMDSAKSTYGLSPSEILSKAKEHSTQEKNGSKIGLSVSISAPLVVLPLTSTSSSAFVADLGHMEVTNTFLPAEKVAVGQHPPEKFLSSGGIPAIVDDMTVDITSVQLFKVNDTTKLKREDWDHMVITPIQFHGHVIRKLSGWCSVVPDFSIDAELPSLEVQLGPGDYSAIFSLISSLGDGKPTTPPSDKGEDKGEGDGGGEKEEEDLKERTPHDTRDAASSSYVKLLMKFKMKEVVLHLNEHGNGVNIERLKFLLSEMETELVMRSWDLSVTASVGCAEIQDYFTRSAEGKAHLLISSGSKERKFLNTTYCKNDPQSPHYGSSPHPTEQTVRADMSVVKVQLPKDVLLKLASMGLSILDEMKANDQSPQDFITKVVQTDEGKTKTVSVARQRLPGEREVYVEARFGGLEVTLGDEHGDILSADMTDLSTTISVLDDCTLIMASMKNIMITDKDPNSCHPKFISKMDDSAMVISSEIKVFKNIEDTSVHISTAEMCVSATVQRLTVFVVFKFVNRVMDYVNVLMVELNLAKLTYGLTEEKSSKVKKQSAQEEKNGSKIGLSVSVSAPLVVLPLTSTSSSAFVADLGHMEVTNTFLFAEKVAVGQHPPEKFLSSGGIPAIVDDMTVDITSVQLFKVNDTAKLKREDWDHMVITPIQFHGHVIRKLSDWCSVVPDFTIDAELPSLEVQLGPGDYSAIFSLMNSLGDGRPTTPPSDKGEDKGEGDGGGEKGEKESKELESKEPEVPTNTKDATSSEVVKLLMTFRMKEVVLHLNEQSADGNVERLKFLLSEMETELVMRNWDLNVSASAGSTEIQDHFSESVEGELHTLMSSGGSVGERFMSVKYCKNDPQSPHYGSSPHPTEQSVIADMSVVKVQILKGSLVKLMSMGLSIMDEIMSGDQSPQDFITKVVQTDEGKTKTVSVAKQHLPGEREVYVEARFGGLEMIVGDEHGEMLSANMIDLSTTVVVLEEWTTVTASMNNILVSDKDPNSYHPKVVSKMDDSAAVISAEIKLFKNIEKTNVNISSAEMCVSATVQRLTVFVVFKFVNRVMDCVNVLMDEMNSAKSTYGLSSAKVSSKGEGQSTQEEKNGSKIGLSVSFCAPLVVLPLTSTSSSAFVADLGQMEVTNTFLFAEKVAVGQHPPEKFLSSGGIPAIVDDMTVDITSVQLFKIEDTTRLKPEDLGHMIITPVQFHGHLIRKLSGWCSVVPDFIIDAELPSLEVQLGPGDYSAILLLMNTLGDGRPTAPPSDKGEDKGEVDGGGEKEEKEEEGSESKDTEAPDASDAASSSYVKLLMKFSMKEVVLHLNEHCDGGNVERLKFLLSEMETELVMNNWDLRVTASIGSAVIHDNYIDSEAVQGKSHLLLSSGSKERKFLKASYCKGDRHSPHYGSSPHPTEQSVSTDMSVVKVWVPVQSSILLMSMANSIMAEISPMEQKIPRLKDDTESGANSAPDKHYYPGERDVYLTANFGGLEVILGDEHGDILNANMTDLQITLTVIENLTEIMAMMKELACENLRTPVGTMTRKIISVCEEVCAITIKMQLCSEATKGAGRTDMSQCDFSVDLDVGRIRVFVVFSVISQVLGLVKQVNSIRTKMVDMSTEESGKSTAGGDPTTTTPPPGTIGDDAPRLRLKAKIDAPELVVPVSSSSCDVFVAYLGLVELSNTFSLGTNTESQQPVFEKDTLQLSKLSLYRSVYQMGTEDPLLCKRHILQDSWRLCVTMQRNLSNAWYKADNTPYIALEAHISELKMALSREDVKFASKLAGASMTEMLPSTEPEPGVSQERPVIAGSTQATGAGFSLRFTASLDQVGVELFENGKLLTVEDKSSWEREPSNLLASLAVVGLKASGSTYDNGLMEAELCMDNFTLDDTRPGTTGIRQAIRKSPLEDGGSKAMVHVTYMSSVQKEQSVVAEVDGAQVLVNLPFISKLADFFMDSLKPLTSSVSERETPQKSEIPKGVGESPSDLETPGSSEMAAESQEDASAQLPQMKVSLSVTRPSVALVEKSGIPNPKTLVLEMDINVNLEMKDEQWHLEGIVESLHMASTNYTSLGHSANYTSVLAPTSRISASLNSAGSHVITVPSLSLTVSPATVRLILNAIRSLQQDANTEDDMPPSAPPDLFSLKEVDKTRWYFASQNSDVDRIASLTRLVSKTSEHGKEEKLKMGVNEVTIVVEKESAIGPNIPIFVLNVGGKQNAEALAVVASNWSSQLSLEAKTYVQVDYYNTSHAIWEPLLEPLIDPKTDAILANWSLEAKVSMSATAQSDVPEMSIEVTSRDVLNLTLTKTCISLINELACAYTEETEKNELVTQPQESYDAIYYLINALGSHHPVSILPGGTLKVQEGYDSILCCRDGCELPLILVDRGSETKKLHREDTTRKVHTVQLEVFGFKARSIVLGRGDKVYYVLWPSNNSTMEYGVVVEIQQQSAAAPRVMLRSPLKLKNHLYTDVDVYWSLGKTTLSSWQPFGSVKKNGGTCNIPLKQAHEGDLILKPHIPRAGYCDPPVPCVMTGALMELSAAVSATPPQDFYIIVSKEEERYSKMTTCSLEKRPHHTLHLFSPYVVRNLLPIPLSLGDVEALQGIKPGSKAPVSMFKGDVIRMPVKLEFEQVMWIGEIEVNINEPMDSTFIVYNPEKGQLKLAVHKEQKGGWKLSLYSKYWIVNKTGLTLEYKYKNRKQYHTCVQPPTKQVLLFAHRKLLVRVQKNLEVSGWSGKFSLDTVGHGGVFVCSCEDGMQYQFGTTIQASGSGLTKIVTILPFFLVQNRTKEQINFSEPDGDIISLASKEMVPFWPKGTSHQMVIKAERDERPSDAFLFTETSLFLLRTSPAIVVDVQVTDASTIITFSPYCLGAAPIQLVNTISSEIIFKQDTDQAMSCILPPSQTMLYTWEDPCGKKELVWNVVGMTPFSNRMTLKDGSGKYSCPYAIDSGSVDPRNVTAASEDPRIVPAASVDPRIVTAASVDPRIVTAASVDPRIVTAASVGPHNVALAPLDPYSVTASSVDPRNMDTVGGSSGITMASATTSQVVRQEEDDFVMVDRTSSTNLRHWTTALGYWACFMDGPQRVVVFSADEGINSNVFGGHSERPQLDVTMSLNAVVVSLVNDDFGREIATIGLTPSDVVWEAEMRRGWWKALPSKLEKELEKLYQSDTRTVVPLKSRGYIHCKVDFSGEDAYLINDAGKRMRLRRSHFDGFFFQWTTTAQFNTLHTWVNNLQVDNHIPHTNNPIILYTWPLPEAIVSSGAPKPFLEGTLVLRKGQQGSGLSVELLQVLIQELALIVDIEFVTSLTTLLEAFADKTATSELIASESKMADTPLGHGDIAQSSTTSTRHYFRLLHLSPLLVHLTLALEMPKGAKLLNVPILGTIVRVLCSFAGLIGKTKDAEMKLGYYQLENALLTQQALKDRVLKHYIQQGLMHFYSVVLGLQVLGNPVGFIRGVAGGAKGIFYHPFEGAIIGPGEFLDGLSLGGREFFGGTVGGISGALGQVLGVTGDAIAKLSFDTEHQEMRHQRTDSIEHAMGGVAMGVFHGLTGLIADPVKGVQEKGPVGLLTGTGKGVAGLITKPTGAVVDLTSTALITIQKKTQVGSVDVVQFRPTRFIGPDKIVCPYSQHKAEGYAIFAKYCLNTGSSRHILETDTFVDYLELDSKPLRCLIITNLRFVITKVTILGGMDKWEFKFKKVLEPVTATADAIVVRVRQHYPFYVTHKQKEQEQYIGCVPEHLIGKAVGIINQAYAEYKQNLV